MKDEHLLAGLTAMEKALHDRVIPGVRKRVEDKLVPQFDGDSGVRRFTHNGKKIARLEVTAEEWVNGDYGDEPCLNDEDAFWAWLDSSDNQAKDMFMKLHMEDFIEWYVDATGELPDGVEMVEVHHPGHMKQAGTKFVVERWLKDLAADYFNENIALLDGTVSKLLEAADE